MRCQKVEDIIRLYVDRRFTDKTIESQGPSWLTLQIRTFHPIVREPVIQLLKQLENSF